MQATLSLSSQRPPRKRHLVGPGDMLPKSSPTSMSGVACHEQSADFEQRALMRFEMSDPTAARDHGVGVDAGLSSPRHWANLGAALREAGRYGEARTAFREARRSAPQDLNAVLGLAYLEMECGRYQHAYEMFRVVLDKSPERFDIKIHIARACYELGKLKRAKALVEGWPRWVLTSDLAVELSAVLIEIGKIRTGLSLLKTVPDLSRIDTHALARLASALARSGRLKKARHCVALLPSLETIHNPALREEILTVCARLALRGGNPFGARRFIEFLDTPPAPGIRRSAKLYFLLAEICYHQLDMEAAKSAFVTGRCIQMKAADIASPLMVEFSSFS